MTPDRRSVLKGALGVSAAAMLGGHQLASATPSRTQIAVPSPVGVAGRSPIEHVVLVMMENRSFDHFLGWLPGANGTGLHPDGSVRDERHFETFRYEDLHGKQHRIYHDEQWNACGELDQDHGYPGGRIQWGQGRMDGFLKDPANTTFSLSYYLAAQRQFTSPLAMHYTVCDNYFCSYLGPTWPNRFFQHSAQTDRQNDTVHPDDTKSPVAPALMPSIWDQFNQLGGPNARYYFSDVPFLGLWGAKYLPISAPVAEFFVDAAAGTLANYTVVDPAFADEHGGTTNDDHPLSDIRAGDSFLSQVFHAVANGPLWDKTLLVINYDEWGGFFDHVAPPRFAPGNQILDLQDVVRDKHGTITQVLGGFRVPCILASPFTKSATGQPRISPWCYDHTSVLRFLQWNWGLHPLTPRDGSIPLSGASTTRLTNLRYALDFGKPDTSVPADIPLLSPFITSGCHFDAPTIGDQPVPAHTHGSMTESWDALRSSGLLAGWL